MIQANITERGYTLAVQGLATLPSDLTIAAARGMKRGLEIAVGVIQRNYLQGPRPGKLGERTGRLRQSISSEVKIASDFKSVKGTVGTNVRYAAFHESGFHGVQNVKSFNRVVSRQGFTQAGTFGPLVVGERFVQGGGSGGKKAAKSQKGGLVTFETVKAHERHVDYDGRPFVSPGLNDSLPLILSEINQEMSTVKPAQ